MKRVDLIEEFFKLRVIDLDEIAPYDRFRSDVDLRSQHLKLDDALPNYYRRLPAAASWPPAAL